MGLYNFQERFAPRIRQWDADPEHPDAKAHTIRAPRKGGREDRPGDTMYLYTGLRRKGAARIIEPPICAKVESVVFFPSDFKVEVWIGPFLSDVLEDSEKQREVIEDPMSFDLVELDAAEREQLAHRDGFESFAEMMAFWDGKLPWYGHIFHWAKMGKTVPMSVLRKVKGARVR